MGSDVINDRRILRPVQSRYPWVVSGLIIQVLAAGPVAVDMWKSIHNQSLGGHVTAEMIKFAWRSELHTRAGLTVLVPAVVIYAIGSVVTARPYISRPVALFVAVPVAAVAGLLLLGVLVLALAVLFVVLENGNLGPADFYTSDGGRRKRRRSL